MPKILSNRRVIIALAISFCAAILVILMIGLNKGTSVDVNVFILPWLRNMSVNGLFDLYRDPIAGAQWAVDYPPLYYSLMFLAGGTKAVELWESGSLAYLYIINIISLICFAAVPVIVFLKTGKLGFPLCWILFLPLAMNIGIQSQSDVVLMSLMIFAYFVHEERKSPVADCIAFAVLCLTKLQGMYFAPVLAVMLYEDYLEVKSIKRCMAGICAGASVGILCWMPFMIHEGNLLLPLKIYFGGFTSQSVWVANGAINIYTILEYFADSSVDPTAFKIVSYATLLLCIAAFFFVYAKTKRISVSAFIYYCLLFFITPNQLSRYSLYSYAFLLLALLYEEVSLNKNQKFFFAIFSFSRFINYMIDIIFLEFRNNNSTLYDVLVYTTVVTTLFSIYFLLRNFSLIFPHAILLYNEKQEY